MKELLNVILDYGNEDYAIKSVTNTMKISSLLEGVIDNGTKVRVIIQEED